MAFLAIHMLVISLQLVLVLQYLMSTPSTVLSTLMSRHNKSFVVHLLKPAISLCLIVTLCTFEVHYISGRFLSPDISYFTDAINSNKFEMTF